MTQDQPDQKTAKNGEPNLVDALFELEASIVRRRLPARARAHRARAYPLENFSAEKQAEIAEAVAQPRPPSRWFPVGPGRRPIAMLPSRAWYEWHWQRGLDPDTKRDSLPRWLRLKVIERDGMVCGLCGGDVDGVEDIHIDHIKPVSHGGSDHISNLQVAHSWCNLSKGARI